MDIQLLGVCSSLLIIINKRYLIYILNSRTPGVYLYDVKIHSLNLLKKLGLEYTIFDTIWYECILSDRSLIGINADENKAVIAEGGNTKVSGIGLNDVGKLAIEALLLPESKNAHLQLSAEEHTINEWVSIYEEV